MKHLFRNILIFWSFILLSGFCLASTNNKPNIIFILADDMDAAAAAFMPNLQKLMVNQGASFSQAFVNSSLCCPSRATILRGQYSQNTGVYSNDPKEGGFQTFHRNGNEKSTIATWLKNAGYRTLLAGKYLNGYPNTIRNAFFIPPGWTDWHVPVAGKPYNEYNYALNENGKITLHWKSAKNYGTDVYHKRTIKFITDAVRKKQPFFAYVSLYAPHSPYTPAPRHAKLFSHVILPKNKNFNEKDVTDKPDYIKKSHSLLSKNQIKKFRNFIVNVCNRSKLSTK